MYSVAGATFSYHDYPGASFELRKTNDFCDRGYISYHDYSGASFELRKTNDFCGRGYISYYDYSGASFLSFVSLRLRCCRLRECMLGRVRASEAKECQGRGGCV